MPFNGSDVTEMLKKTIEGSYTINDKRWKNISKIAKDFVQGLLENDPEDRISLDEALNHPWMVENQRPEGGCTVATLSTKV